MIGSFQLINFSYSLLDVPDTPDGDIHAWIEEQRAKIETDLGLDLFLRGNLFDLCLLRSFLDLIIISVYRCLEAAIEPSSPGLQPAMTEAADLLGSDHSKILPDILQLIVTESVHFQ